MIKGIIFLVIIFSLVIALQAGAVVSGKTQKPTPTATQTDQTDDDDENGATPSLIATPTTSVKPSAEALKAQIAERLRQIEREREELRLRIENNASSTAAAIAAKREALKQKITANRQQLKEKLAAIKNEVKRNIVERIDDRLAKLNERLTEHYLNVLAQLEKVLNNIGSRADKAEASGVNVSKVRTAITNAQNAINSSREAVKAQAEKIYEITVSTEDKLKVDVGKARQALAADLKAVRDKIKSARDLVHQAAVLLGQIKAETPAASVSPSPSASPTPSASATP